VLLHLACELSLLCITPWAWRCLLLSELGDVSFVVNLASWSLNFLLSTILTSLILLLSLSSYSTCHQLINLLVGLLNFWSQNIFNLLLVASESGSKLLGWLLTRHWSAWRRSFESFCLTSLSYSRLRILRKLRLVRLNSERDDASSNLNSFCHLRLKLNLALCKNKSSKLGEVVLKIKATVLLIILDESMASTNRYVADSDVTFVTSSQLEHFLFCIGHNQMNHSWWVFFKGKGLEQEEVSIRWQILLYIYQPVWDVVGSEDIRVWLFADFALKLLPGVRYEILLFFFCHFLLEPVFEALIMDISHWSIALATIEKRVFYCGCIVPANFALNIRACNRVDHSAIDLDCFLLEFFSKRI